MRSPNTQRFALWMLLVLSPVIISCGQPATAMTTETGSLTKLAIQLAWLPSTEYSPFFIADQKGYYNEEKLDVTVLPRAEKPTTEIVASGEAQFGITSADRLLLARDAGMPLVAIATLYQRCPVSYTSLTKNGIVHPEDFIGKKVEIDINGSTGLVYQAFLKSQGIAADQITLIPQPDATNDVQRLINGEVDVIDGFFNAQPVHAVTLGQDINNIYVSDYGIDIYADIIYTTETMVKEHPEVVQQFLRATLKGFQNAIDKPKDAVDAVLAVDNSLNPDNEMRTMQLALPMFKPLGSDLGMMTDASWKMTDDLLVDLKMYKNPADVSKAYDLSFLRAIYGELGATSR